MKSLGLLRHCFRQRTRSIHSPVLTKRVAILYQALEPPVINGVRKPKKPGGYQDSGADIAYVLREQCKIPIITPIESPSPTSDEGWCFPDHEAGILDAIHGGATHLWANTILFADHPLQTSSKLTPRAKEIYVVGQPPLLVDRYDDKALVNAYLRENSACTLPKSFNLGEINDLEPLIAKHRVKLPLIAKPIRGRGSHGVKLCHSLSELAKHAYVLLQESPTIMVEDYLEGQEITLTVMPPSPEKPKYWALPIVTRFNHQAGIAPYNGLIAATQNSRTLPMEEVQRNPIFNQALKECVSVAERLSCTAPIRIDMRQLRKQDDSPYALFDVNMKPNMTGPGRPGREDQASLTAMAAGGLGWNYPRLLEQILHSAPSLDALRRASPPDGFIHDTKVVEPAGV